MKELSSQELMTICENYWAAIAAGTTLDKSQAHVLYEHYVKAQTELAQRGVEIREWCRSLLTHPDYDARECGAFLLGELGKRHLLGEAEEKVVAELGALTKRPVKEDGKELQAIDAAIIALAAINNRWAIPFFRDILFSDDEWLMGDTQWSAACELGRLLSEPFNSSPEPIEAARAWLLAHPDF